MASRRRSRRAGPFAPAAIDRERLHGRAAGAEAAARLLGPSRPPDFPGQTPPPARGKSLDGRSGFTLASRSHGAGLRAPPDWRDTKTELTSAQEDGGWRCGTPVTAFPPRAGFVVRGALALVCSPSRGSVQLLAARRVDTASGRKTSWRRTSASPLPVSRRGRFGFTAAARTLLALRGARSSAGRLFTFSGTITPVG